MNPKSPIGQHEAPGSVKPGSMDWSQFVSSYGKAIDHPLDDEQQKAVKHGTGPLFIMAGPGSGKSEVIVARTLKLVLVDGVDPRSILVTTFTNKAARNIEDRVSDRLLRMGFQSSLDELKVGTLHSLCDGIMRDFRFDVYHDSRLLDDVEQSFFIHKELHDWLRDTPKEFWESFRYLHPEANLEFGPNLWQKADTFQTLINRVTEEEVPVNALIKSGSAHLKVLSEGIELYRTSLNSRSRSDFAHVQEQFKSFLQSPVGRVFLQGDQTRGIPPLRFILVDEYQDTNPIQESIYFILAMACAGNITVVGDDDQALYRFRGGTVECLVRFRKRCEAILNQSVQTRQLAVNYRSVKEISDWCSRILTNQPAMALKGARVAGKKPMESDRGPAEGYIPLRRIEGDRYKDVGEEVAAIVGALIQKSFVQDPADIAILLRSTKESPWNAGPIVGALRDAGIPVYNPRSKAFVDAPEIATMLGGLIHLVDVDRFIAGSLRGRQLKSIGSWSAAWEENVKNHPEGGDYVRKVHERLKKVPKGTYLLTVELLPLCLPAGNPHESLCSHLSVD